MAERKIRMTTLHELFGIFLIVLGMAIFLIWSNFASRLWRGEPWGALCWDMLAAVVIYLFLLALYHTL